LLVADVYNDLGLVYWNRGDFDACERVHRAALAIRERLLPGSEQVAYSYTNLGIVYGRRGWLVEAEAAHRAAIAVYRRRQSEGDRLGRALNNLSLVLRDRGDYVAAAAALLESIALHEQHGTERDLAHSLGNLGSLELERGNREAAEAFLRRSLALKEKLGLGVDLWPTLANLSDAVTDPGERERLLLRAAALVAEKTPESGFRLNIEADLGALALERGDLVAAGARLDAAAVLVERLQPGSDHAGRISRLQGRLAARKGDLAAAERHLRQALAIHLATEPGTASEIADRLELARVLRRQDRPGDALDMLEASAALVESYIPLLGEPAMGRSRLRATFAELYFEQIDLLLGAGRRQEAFHVLERSRGRELAILLASRDLVFTELPPELDRRRHTAETAYRRALDNVRKAAAGKREAAQGQLGEARRALLEVETVLQREAPRLAELRQPPAFDLAAIQEGIGEGTVVLAYAVGAQRTHVFVLGPGAGELTTATVDITADALGAKVRALADAVARPSARRSTWWVQARSLGEVLLTPAAPQLARARRVLVLADGPLHLLPFAVLPVPQAGGDRLLLEVADLYFAPSATVAAQLAPPAGRARPLRLTAFADPLLSVETHPPERVAAAGTRGLDLAPLPASREEVAELQRLFPRQVEVYVGPAATEERAKDLGADVTHVHFAVHGLLDAASPLDSGLALSPSSAGHSETLQAVGNDGLLQAWEVFSQVRLRADLVTLSACETALGEVAGAEGVLGLTRAFQFAGAREVLATQWKVSDRPTRELMTTFYRGLRDGLSTAGALRKAQLRLLGRPATAHPYYWAAFQLHGDWR
jgi:CHAT domain-containing protein/tetratricopeptide (TPR) repeat protein